MDYQHIVAFLLSLQGETTKLSLDNIQALVARLPFAYHKVRYIQVAGTNGKGSTSHFIAAILQTAHYRVGLFTSPHLEDVRERIRFGGRIIGKRDFIRSVLAVRRMAAQCVVRGEIANLPTFFEMLFLASLYYFHEKNADFAVMEVGLGGRLDATTTLQPVLGVITSIALDHTNILGRSIGLIAAEKAGIIKPGMTVVSGCKPGSQADKVIAAVAAQRQARCVSVFATPTDLLVQPMPRYYQCAYTADARVMRFRVYLAGRHQTRNAAIAVRAIIELERLGYALSAAAIASGIRRSFIPGRIERFATAPEVIIDGGHNAAGMQSLCDYLHERHIQGATLVFGVLRDKAYAKMARLIAPFAGRVILCTPPSPRALPARLLLPFFAGNRVSIATDFEQAYRLAKKNKSIIIMTGSLYLAGALRPIVLKGVKRGHEKIQRSRAEI